eukprot:1324101-Amorphochlora_amoeboformis.AAC.1
MPWNDPDGGTAETVDGYVEPICWWAVTVGGPADTIGERSVDETDEILEPVCWRAEVEVVWVGLGFGLVGRGWDRNRGCVPWIFGRELGRICDTYICI